MVRKFIFLLFLTIGIIQSAFSQNNALSVRISYSAIQKPLPTVLKEIEKLSTFRFTFNSAIISENELITISAQQKTLEEILTIVLKDKYSFKLIGNQILIFEPPKKTEAKTQPKPTPTNSIKNKKIITDTIRVYDTIKTFIHDTISIKVYDTIRFYDTIRKTTKPNIKQNKSTLTYAFYTGQMVSIPYTSGAINNTYKSNLKNSETLGWGNTESIWAMYKKQSLLVGIGLQHTNIRYKSNFNTTTYINDGTATYTDTLWYWKYSKLFTYYKFNSSGDSVAITVYDSLFTYKIEENPKKIEQIKNIRSNIALHYISIPISVGYSYNINNTITIEPSFSLYTQILTYRKGLIPGINTDVINIRDLPIKRLTYSLGLSCNTSFAIYSHYSLLIKPFFIIQPKVYKNENSFQKTIPIFGIEWGISYTIPYELF